MGRRSILSELWVWCKEFDSVHLALWTLLGNDMQQLEVHLGGPGRGSCRLGRSGCGSLWLRTPRILCAFSVLSDEVNSMTPLLRQVCDCDRQFFAHPAQVPDARRSGIGGAWGCIRPEASSLRIIRACLQKADVLQRIERMTHQRQGAEEVLGHLHSDEEPISERPQSCCRPRQLDVELCSAAFAVYAQALRLQDAEAALSSGGGSSSSSRLPDRAACSSLLQAAANSTGQAGESTVHHVHTTHLLKALHNAPANTPDNMPLAREVYLLFS
mmetsp:Transcript_76078/g.181057  ORF Transcript_76078/g.181057 Transcript_76078/m.181057 type:complete len:271 (+) Transcript_76078:5418-6230(+)